jgi:deoxyribose-phosphate aldolase
MVMVVEFCPPPPLLTRSMFYHGRDAGKTKHVVEANELASKLDVTIARADAQAADVHKAAAEAMRLRIACLFAPPVWTSRLATMLRGSGVGIGSLVAFPHGYSKPTIKAIEATSTIKDGAERIEIVPHLANLLSLDVDGARAELIEIARSARAARREVNLSVTIDVALLWNRRGERAVELACRAVREGGCDGTPRRTRGRARLPRGPGGRVRRDRDPRGRERRRRARDRLGKNARPVVDD